MIIEKKVKLKNSIYYIVVDVEYKINDVGITELCIKKYNDSYFDSGNLSLLIEKIENSYNNGDSKKYDSKISFMNDVIYLYNRIPFLSGIKEVYSKDSDLPSTTCYISKEEINKYIEEHKIKMDNNLEFKLSDERTWII